MFLFWSLAAGIVIGAGMIPLAVIGSILVGLILYALSHRKITDTPYMLVLRCADEASEKSAMARLDAANAQTRVKAKTITAGEIELSIEVRLKDASTAFVNQLSSIPGIASAALVSYSGEYMS